jgi:poly(3-hydroxybutyrate) depolymerase
MSLASNIDFLRHLPKLRAGTGRFSSALKDGANNRLLEVSGFGSNPGNLRMFSFVPDHLKNDTALVVVLHGCTKTRRATRLEPAGPRWRNATVLRC